MPAADPNPFAAAARLIDGADALVIAAGAGIGVDSGLPDFRGNAGFWHAYPALAEAGLAFTAVASPRTFERDLALAWGFYGHRLALYRATVPHEGFAILRRWGDAMALGARVFTSNVDGQFQQAGFAEALVHECHGSIRHLQCMDERCGAGIWPADGFAPEVDMRACRLLNPAPRCPRCGGPARPNVLMFGDADWLAARSDGQARREAQWLQALAAARARVVLIELGAGTAIASVRHFGQRLIRDLGAVLVRINPREAEVPGVAHLGIASGALAALRAIDAERVSWRRPASSPA